jgi:hypothetical protein
MRSARLVFAAAAALGLLTCAASAQTIVNVGGQYYKLVPVNGHTVRVPVEVLTAMPQNATASVPDTSNCRLLKFEAGGQYQPQYTTACGAP